MILAAMLLSCVQLFAQGTISVSGTVTDRAGEPVIGAGVFVKGTTLGASTSLDGAYALDNVPADAMLEVSCIGYKSLELAVNGRARIDIVLDEESLEIDDAMVVAYGTAKKESFTGSAACSHRICAACSTASLPSLSSMKRSQTRYLIKSSSTSFFIAAS